MKIKNGITFSVVGENIIGEIDELTRQGIWSVAFRKNGYLYARYDVYESTIIHNFEIEKYKLI